MFDFLCHILMDFDCFPPRIYVHIALEHHFASSLSVFFSVFYPILKNGTLFWYSELISLHKKRSEKYRSVKCTGKLAMIVLILECLLKAQSGN